MAEDPKEQLQYDNVEGNYYDKYGSKNPIARYLMDGFFKSLLQLLEKTGTQNVYEAGCGEGHLSLFLCDHGYKVRGSDIGKDSVAHANDSAQEAGCQASFAVKSIYDLDESDSERVMICCEVLEHVDDPERALASLSRVVGEYLVVSVPREPIWRFLNLVRGKYIGSLGNTPGHIQHWSKRSFVALLEKYFDVLEVKTPLPWTMVLLRVKDTVN